LSSSGIIFHIFEKCKLAKAIHFAEYNFGLASFAGISPEESGGGKSLAKTHREACGGG
jgi:hypothetical protein